MSKIPERIYIPEYVPVFDKVPWLNAQRQDYKLLKNTP